MYVYDIKDILTDFKTAYTAAFQKWNLTRKSIEENYTPNSREGERKLTEAKTLYDDTVQQLKMAATEKINSLFESSKSAVTEKAMSSLPEGFTDVLEAIKVMGKPTEIEITAYFDKYKDNYLATRALMGAFNANLGKERFSFSTSFDDIINALEDTAKQALRLVREVAVNTYNYAVLITERDSNPLVSFEIEVSDFVNGSFSILDINKYSA